MIIRTPKKTRFTVIGNVLINDQRLSWAALGMLVYLLSKPDDWRILPAHLIKERQLGRDGVYRLLKELEQAGYVRKQQVKNTAGRMAGTDWCVFDEPQVAALRPESPHPEIPDTAPPHPALPYPADPTLTKTTLSIKTDGNQHTYADRSVQRDPETVALAQPCVCISPSILERERAESPTPPTAIKPSVSQPSAVRSDTPRRPPPGPRSCAAPVATPAASALPPVPPPVQEAPPTVALGLSPSVQFHSGPSLRTPLDAIEQDAFAWAARHPFWHSRITTPENLRRNFQEGRAFRLQFLDAQNAKALASGISTDPGFGDLAENHTPYRGYYHAESDRYFQSAPAVGELGSFHPGDGARISAGERQRKPSAVERAARAEQRYDERLARERAAATRTIAGERLDPPGYAAALAASDPALRASLDVTIW